MNVIVVVDVVVDVFVMILLFAMLLTLLLTLLSTLLSTLCVVVVRRATRHVPQTKLLVVTDVAARGIDVPLLNNVVNYAFPPAPKLFVHRVGRAARQGRTGTVSAPPSCLFLAPRPQPRLLYVLGVPWELPTVLPVVTAASRCGLSAFPSPLVSHKVKDEAPPHSA